jgi:shikimate dehydrogenase
VRSATAERVGAVNTVWVDGTGRLVGDNTDVGGFSAALRVLGRSRGDSPGRADRRRVAARPRVLAALAEWPGVRVRLWSGRLDPAIALARAFHGVASVARSPADAARGASLVINATPLGLHDGDPSPIPVEQLPAARRVFDLAYAPARTAWVARRPARGPTRGRRARHARRTGRARVRALVRSRAGPGAMWGALADVLAVRAGR